MTENKRFEICGEGSTNVDVTTYIVEYGDGDDDCFELYESKEDSQKVCDKINNILDENEQLKFQNSNLMKEVAEYSRKAKELEKENEQLKQPNCRNCIHFSCDNADIYCMEKGYVSIPDCSIAKDCDEYEGLYE